MNSAQALLTSVWLWISTRLERERIRFVCLAVLAISLALLVVSFLTSDHGRTVFGPPLGADYAGFYTAGTILNRYPPEQLYDAATQDQLYHQLLPNVREEEELPYVHPPFVALAFRLPALLPYEWSFALWLAISAGLYVGGLALTWKSLPALAAENWSSALLLALSFEPFIMECWLGGQLSAVGFFCLALAFACEQASRPFAAGLALGVCLYKPPLLLLLIPMLLLAPRFRMLAGFALSGLVLAGISLRLVGPEACLDYGRVVLGFTQTTTGGPGSDASGGLALRLWKYVDLNCSLRLLLGHSPLVWPLLLGIVAGPLVGLAFAWRRLDRHGAGHRNQVWATTLAWTLAINLYVGVYDTILAVLAALVTADVILRRGRAALAPAFQFLLVLLYLAPWLSQPIARATHVQFYAVVLIAMATYQLILARRLALSPYHSVTLSPCHSQGRPSTKPPGGTSTLAWSPERSA